MRYPKFILNALGFLILSTVLAFAGTTTLTTYYPSPTGNYGSLNATGNVGIGTLSVSYTVAIGTTAPIGTSNLSIGTTTLASSGNPVTIDLGGSYSSAAGQNLKINLLDDGLGDMAGFGISHNQMDYVTWGSSEDHVFYQYANQASSATELMRIKGSGNVGIGTASPKSMLETIYQGNYSNAEFSGNGLQTSTGHCDNQTTPTCPQDYTLYMGADRTNALSYIQSVEWGVNIAPLSLNARGGNVGIGTFAPLAKLDVNGNVQSEGSFTMADNNNSASNNYKLFLAGSGDANHYIYSSGTNGNNMYFGEYGAGATTAGWHFYDTEASTDRVTILGNGNVGIAQSSPGEALDVNGFIRGNNEIISSNIGTGGYGQFRMIGGNYGAMFRNDGANTYFLLTALGSQYGTWNTLRPLTINDVSGDVSMGGNLTVSGSLTVTGNITSTGGCVTGDTCSDIRLKQNIRPLPDPLSKLDQLHGVSFQWNHLAGTMGLKEGQKNIGMIAQDMKRVYPELVGSFKKGNTDYLTIDYSKFTAVLLESIKELKTQVNTLQGQINVLKNKVDTLEKQK